MTKHTENITSQGVAARQLQAIIDRLQRLEEEIKGLNDDKKAVYEEAKGNGYDVKAIKIILSELRKKDKNPDAFSETQAMVELYKAALGLGGVQIDMFAGKE
jgi:uncharacterized protein (UPF0335 family)